MKEGNILDLNNDIRKAQVAELEVKEFLEKYFFKYFGNLVHSKGYNPRGDLYSKKAGIYIEIKEDLKVDETNRFFLEEKALVKSESPIWCYLDNDFYYFIRKIILDEFTRDNQFMIKYGGDDKKFKGWLIPRQEFRKHSKIFPRSWRQDEGWYKKYIMGGTL